MTNTVKRDTGAAKLPALPVLKGADPALSSWVRSVSEWLQIREGQRGNPLERSVTMRELQNSLGALQSLADVVNRAPEDGEVGIEIAPGVTASVAVERFAQFIIESKLFKDLTQSLTDPARFDGLPEEVRDELRKDLSTEAKRLKAAIQDVQRAVDSNERSYAMAIRQLTASLRDANAGFRQTTASWTDGSRAMAINVLQLTSSLGNYYQDGTEGRASLEQSMSTLASYADGLRAQYTMKLQAGGAMAGIGLAAEDVNGKITSAFIISAAQFAIVPPNYNGGVLSVPRPQDLVFGTDADGIYMQQNVYLKGNMRIDGSTRSLRDGLRGSLQLAASGEAWSDTTARQAVWLALGNSGSALSSNHLVIGDMVTIVAISGAAITRHWIGNAWANPGVVINGGLLVDGSVAARAINTNGLTVRDNAGNIILSSGGMDAAWLRNLMASQVGGLGSLATQNHALIGSTVRMPDGSVMNAGDFVNRLSKMESWNIDTFMGSAAIGSAHIGNLVVKNAHLENASVSRLKVAGGTVTSMNHAKGSGYGSSNNLVVLKMESVAGGTGFIVNFGAKTSKSGWQTLDYVVTLLLDGVVIETMNIGNWNDRPNGDNKYGSVCVFVNPGPGDRVFSINATVTSANSGYIDAWMAITGGMR
ncbi:MAG: DUF1983 domain-containing protein [Comamonas sp.]